MLSEFPAKGWKKTTVNDFLKRLKETGSATRKSGSGRPRTVRTVANISAVNDLVLGQEDAPQTHRTTRQIARETDIRSSSVVQIIREELHLKCIKKHHAQTLTEAKCITRLSRAKKLLNKFPESAVDFIFFTDEKVFTIAPPVNPQNNRVYAPCGTKKRDIVADCLFRTRPTFSKSVMVSVTISKLECTELIFVEPEVKVEWSPDLWPPNSPDLNPVNSKIWGCVQERMYQKPIRDVDQLKQRLVEVWSDVQQTVVDAASDE